MIIPGLGALAGGRIRSANRDLSGRAVALTILAMVTVVTLSVLLAFALS